MYFFAIPIYLEISLWRQFIAFIVVYSLSFVDNLASLNDFFSGFVFILEARWNMPTIYHTNSKKKTVYFFNAWELAWASNFNLCK